MTKYAVLVIQNTDNDIRCEALGQDKKTKKWVGAISLYHDKVLHTILVSFGAIFNSSDEAIKSMKRIVKKVHALDLLA